MASALQKLLRKSLPSSRIITAFDTSKQALKNPLEPLPLLRLSSPLLEIYPEECHRPTTTTIPSPATTPPFSSSFSTTVIYPSFPFGFASKPIFATGFCSPEAEDEGLDDSKTVWADSVKKKRKRKMNKHKYKKLRKRMRRQT